MIKKLKDSFFYFWSMFFYYIGHYISIPMFYYDLGFLYPVYVFFMDKSHKIQEYAELNKPWIKPDENE